MCGMYTMTNGDKNTNSSLMLCSYSILGVKNLGEYCGWAWTTWLRMSDDNIDIDKTVFCVLLNKQTNK